MPGRARRGSRLAGWAAIGLTGFVFWSAVAAVAPAQSYHLFKVRVAASEGSAWIVAAALLVAVLARWAARPAWIAVLALASAGMALVPLARAWTVATVVPAELARAFGSSAATLPDSRPSPLVWADLFRGLSVPDLEPSAIVFREVDGVELALDVYRPPAGPGPYPVVLVVHGGGWRGGTRHEFDGLSRYLAQRGFLVASTDYRLAPAHPFPAARDDVAAALAAIKSHAGDLHADAARVVLVGRSAGAQLALLAAYTSRDPAVRGVVGFYGPTDLVYGYTHPADPKVYDSTTTLATYIGGHLRERRASYEMASPINYVTPATPPTLLVHGTPDELVDKEQSRRLARQLRGAGVPHLLVELPWASHACDYFLRGPCGQISTYAVERFLGAVITGGGAAAR